MSRPPIITALLDANVLYPAPLRDYLLYLASLGVYEPVWTTAIQDEWIRNLLKARPEIERAALEETHRSMDKAFPGSNTTDYESLIESLSLPDPDDRHVLAAAIKAKAQVIVTANLKDFPACALIPYAIRLLVDHPIQVERPDGMPGHAVGRDLGELFPGSVVDIANIALTLEMDQLREAWNEFFCYEQSIALQLQSNFVEPASPRSSSFLTFASLGYTPFKGRISIELSLVQGLSC